MRSRRIRTAALVTALITGCGGGSDSTDRTAGSPPPASSPGGEAPPPAAAPSSGLRLRGGADQSIDLGCIDCDRSEPESICNLQGPFGDPTSPASIWNVIGEYGSPSSVYSPWNAFTIAAPLVVVAAIVFGHLSVNRRHPDRTTIRALVLLLDFFEATQDVDGARDFFCEG